MKAIGLKRVAAVNSFLQAEERRYILQRLDEYKLLFVSPETLQQRQFLDQICNIHVHTFVIDEAHCISQWGYEFRPDYMRLGEVIEKLGNPTVLALSATATEEVQRDIIHVLKKTWNQSAHLSNR
ncbi:DEAD/DEAH box helicase [Virgibacillus halophilus]|uniref:DEAD/DEAH box helicase n=1 Tax=Tigheibacillus halophilus TaxID=361280 RepID=A0ABU5CB36_9BACI|nr:DEAD/DEAH box helicase [Virgibacillus halophilus]